MSSPASDIATLLAGGAFGFTLGTNAFVSHQPDTPDVALTAFDTGGFDPTRTLTPTTDMHQPTVQLRLRGSRAGYDTAYALLELMRTWLHGQTDVTVDGTRYVSISVTSDIFSLGVDEKERPALTANFRLER